MCQKIRVMLVDDEYLAIEDLKTLIDWGSLGFEICATACSGRQALHLFKEAPVDLIITDISMPGMNGITLIEELKLRKNNLFFLLLTAYAEIDYMKKAFKLGVKDYLIKDEITPEILQEKLSLIRQDFLTYQKQQYSLTQKTIRQYFSSSTASLSSNTESVFQARLLYCILTPDIIFPWVEELTSIQSLSISEMLNSVLPFIESYKYEQLSNLCSVIAYNNKILILLQYPDAVSTNKIMGKLRNFSQNLIFELKERYHLSFSCFYSYLPMTLEAIHTDYFFRQKSIRARYFLGRGLVEPLNSEQLYITSQKLHFTEETLKELFEKSADDLISFLDLQFEEINKEHNYSGLTHLINICFWFLSRQIPNFPSDSSIDLTDIHAIQNYIRHTIFSLYEKKNTGISYETRKALSYIEVHYGKESLSIQEIADEIGLSVTHFSRIFKENTGETVWDYLTSLRMKKSRQLLETTDDKIYEIAEKCGYSSPQYFSQVFYKQLGMKPLDYRKKVRQ